MACDKILVVKILELIFCLACMIYMRVTDYESRQVFYLLEKLNREWPLLNSVTWEENGSIFTHVVFGSYIIITLGLLIGYLCGELKSGSRKMEKYFLGVGALLFIIVGSLIFASLDSVPPYLVKNAAALGTIALLTGLLFILDLGLSRPKPPPIVRLYKATQTEAPSHSVDLLNKVYRVPNGDRVIGELRSSLKSKRSDQDLRYPSQHDSTPDLTIHENGRGFSVRSRGSPEEQSTPEGYRRNELFHPDHDFDRHGREMHPRATPESSVHPGVQFPSEVEVHHKRISQAPSDSIQEYVQPSRDRDRRSIPPQDQTIPSKTQYTHNGNGHFPPDRDRRSIPPRDQGIPSKMQYTHNGNGHFPPDLDLQQKRVSRERDESHHQIPKDRPEERFSVVKSQRPDSNQPVQSHRMSDTGTRNSNSSSGDQRFLEQSEISQRPESITPEERHRIKPGEYGSDSEVDDLMRVPTVTFRLADGGEPVEAHPGRGGRGVKQKSQRTAKGSLKTPKLLPMMPISSPKDMYSSRSRSADALAQEIKQKPTRDDAGSPASVPDEREDKEKYLFGIRPRLTSTKSLDVETGRMPGFESVSQSPSPDVGHWRFDSRDANLVRLERELPSSPSDPGFVRHAAQVWPATTPSQSPEGFSTPGGSRMQNWPESRPRTPSQSPQTWMESAPQTPSRSRLSSDEGDYAIASPPPKPPSKPPVPPHKQEESKRPSKKGRRKQDEEEEEDDIEDVDMPSGGSLTTQLIQKWLKQRKTKVGKSKSEP